MHGPLGDADREHDRYAQTPVDSKGFVGLRTGGVSPPLTLPFIAAFFLTSDSRFPVQMPPRRQPPRIGRTCGCVAPTRRWATMVLLSLGAMAGYWVLHGGGRGG